MAQVTKGGHSVRFHSMDEFEEWMEWEVDSSTWRVKFYRGESHLIPTPYFA